MKKVEALNKTKYTITKVSTDIKGLAYRIPEYLAPSKSTSHKTTA